MTTTIEINYDVHTDDYPVNIYQGETWSMSVQVQDSNGNAYPLTGYSAEMTIRQNPNGPVLIDLTVGSGITIDQPNGIIGCAMTAAQTAALEFANAGYDLFIKSGGGTLTPLLKGPANLTLRFTRMP